MEIVMPLVTFYAQPCRIQAAYCAERFAGGDAETVMNLAVQSSLMRSIFTATVAKDDAHSRLSLMTSLFVVVSFGFETRRGIQTASITELQQSWRVFRHVSEDILVWKGLKILIANWTLEALPEIPDQILLSLSLVVPEMLLLLLLVQCRPTTITKRAFADLAEGVLMRFQVFGNVFHLVFRERGIAELASWHPF
jgi:hypothetical protein